MLPSMENDLNGSEVMGAALQPIFYMIEDSSEDDFKQILFPLVHRLINIPRSVQVCVQLKLLVVNDLNACPLFIGRLFGYLHGISHGPN